MRLLRGILILAVLGIGFLLVTGRARQLYGTCHVAVAGTSATVTFAGVLGPRQCQRMIDEGEGKILPLTIAPTGGRVCYFDAQVETIEVRSKDDARDAATNFCDQLRAALGKSKIWSAS
jgi:hypothetical protein